MNIELRHLRYFVAVAEELHFGRAAARLNISQPPLSQQIQILEQQVGARLLARTNRSVALTSAGKQFLADSRQILGWLMKPPPWLSVCIWEKQGIAYRLYVVRAVYQSGFRYVIYVSPKLPGSAYANPRNEHA